MYGVNEWDVSERNLDSAVPTFRVICLRYYQMAGKVSYLTSLILASQYDVLIFQDSFDINSLPGSHRKTFSYYLIVWDKNPYPLIRFSNLSDNLMSSMENQIFVTHFCVYTLLKDIETTINLLWRAWK